MEKQKTALVIGTTGGVGGMFAGQLIDAGYVVFGPVRNEDKALDIFGDNPMITFEKCDLEKESDVLKYLQNVAKEGVFFDVVVLAAGKFEWDRNFAGNTPKEQQETAIAQLTTDNYLTKETVVLGLEDVFGKKLEKTMLLLISSQAATFKEDDPRRLNEKTGYTEEGYVISMEMVSSFGKRLEKEGLFRKVVVDEPGLISTPEARKNFNKETIGEDPDWENIQSPEEYVKSILKKCEIIEKPQ